MRSIGHFDRAVIVPPDLKCGSVASVLLDDTFHLILLTPDLIDSDVVCVFEFHPAIVPTCDRYHGSKLIREMNGGTPGSVAAHALSPDVDLIRINPKILLS